MTKLRFGDVEIDLETRGLAVGGKPAKLGSRAFDLLMVLVERRDRVVTKAELLDLVWPGLFVEENNLATQIKSLRRILGHQAFSTVPGRGYRFVLASDTAPSSPTRAEVVPAPIDPLIGREAELAELAGAVEQQRLVSLVGAGGIGKTRLAHAVAIRWREGHPEGYGWVDLAPLDAPSQVAPAIASVCGTRLEAGEPREQLARTLAGRRLLLVLDNCEHLAEEAAACARSILERCPEVRILATTQVLLHVAGEHAYRLEGLAVPLFGRAARRSPRVRSLEAVGTASTRVRQPIPSSRGEHPARHRAVQKARRFAARPRDGRGSHSGFGYPGAHAAARPAPGDPAGDDARRA
jgi:DNA-binding winged helix-turn-helix (wHTH) protein